MKTLAERPSGVVVETQEFASAVPQGECLQSFNPVAAVNMFRYDLQRQGSVRPETYQQVQDEQLSYLVEGINRAACTEFVFRRQEGSMQYFKDGQWRPYDDMLMTGLEAAKADAAKDYRRNFLVEWAGRDIYNALQMQKLRPGEQRVWYSSYPHEEAARYGTSFMQECGLDPTRQLGFIYRASCNDKREIILQSQTVDGSYAAGFAASSEVAAQNPQAQMIELVEAYDESYARKLGQKVYAGRVNAERNENGWQDLLQHSDLISFFMQGVEVLARNGDLQGKPLEQAVRRHLYGTWAAFKNRLDGKSARSYENSSGRTTLTRQALLRQEVNQAFREFAREGKRLVGCGGEIRILMGEDNILNASIKDAYDGIFGRDIVENAEEGKVPRSIRCIECKVISPKEQVVKEKTWRCPHCKYEIDICTGDVLQESVQGNSAERKPSFVEIILAKRAQRLDAPAYN